MSRLLNEGLDVKPRFKYAGQSMTNISRSGNTSISGRSILQVITFMLLKQTIKKR